MWGNQGVWSRFMYSFSLQYKKMCGFHVIKFYFFNGVLIMFLIFADYFSAKATDGFAKFDIQCHLTPAEKKGWAV